MSDIDLNETEADTRANRIDPEINASGWRTTEGARVYREMLCPGRIIGGGKHGTEVAADYVFEYRGQKLAVVEAKKASLRYTEGHAQALDYATRTGARFAYCTNGIKWREIDMKTAKERDFDLPFPTPDELWAQVFETENTWRNALGNIPLAEDGGKWEPRYYQHRAITAVMEAVAHDKKRILLTLATGTGKTAIALQISWKLYQARWNLQGDKTRRPRILFLADRNILADQAYNSFSAFKEDARCRITPKEISKLGEMPKNGNVFFSIFQTFMSSGADSTGEDETNEDVYIADETANFRQYPADFFDLIIIDECHRAGATDASPWRGLLEYFEPALQLGLTATPKRKDNGDTYAYFGEPVYKYSLKEGIEDGYLTPFKVRQMSSNLDTYTYDPDSGDEIVSGELEEGREYTGSDFQRYVIIPEREKKRIDEFYQQIDPNDKTLVFCATQDHAAMVRDYINEIKLSNDPNYCARVTADDGTRGETNLRQFQDNAKIIPTILTTSRKLSTGVDAKNVRNIVLMRPITTMTEFKQIIGRGTRTYDGKDFFTIFDFVKAYEHFNDEEWDGEPAEPITKPHSPRDDTLSPERPEPDPDEPPQIKPEAAVVELSDGSKRKIIFTATSTYWMDGKPISANEFLNRLFGDLSQLITDEADLREKWSDPENRKLFLNKLEDRGFEGDRLEEMAKLIDASNCDIFDVLAYVRFNLEPLERIERKEKAQGSALSGYEPEMCSFLISVLDAYVEHGVSELETEKLSETLRANYGDIREAQNRLGTTSLIKSAYLKVQKALYAA